MFDPAMNDEAGQRKQAEEQQRDRAFVARMRRDRGIEGKVAGMCRGESRQQAG